MNRQITIRKLLDELKEEGWNVFCINNQIRMAFQTCTPNELQSIDIQEETVFPEKMIGSIPSNYVNGLDSSVDAAFETQAKFPEHFEYIVILNFGSRTNMHDRYDKDNTNEVNVDICGMNTIDVYDMIKNTFSSSKGNKKYSILWGPTHKHEGEWSVNLLDLQCMAINDVPSNEHLLFWVNRFSCKESIADKFSASDLCEKKYSKFPMIFSRPSILHGSIYITFMPCVYGCDFQYHKTVFKVL